jgi:hypothetical protein
MYTLDQRMRLHPEVIDTVLADGETVLLQLESTTYYSLNPTGTQIWQGLKQGLPLGEISQRLQAGYAVEADHAERSVLTFVNELVQHQLVLLAEG